MKFFPFEKPLSTKNSYFTKSFETITVNQVCKVFGVQFSMRNSAKSTAEKNIFLFIKKNLLQFSSFYQHEKIF